METGNLHFLPETLLEQLKGYGSCLTYQDGEVIHARGDNTPGLSVVYRGQVKIGNYGLDGQYCLTRILEQGETFGEFTLFAGLPRTHHAEAHGMVEIIQLTAPQYQKCSTQFPELTSFMLSSLAIRLHTSLEILDDMRRLSLPVRTAKLLLSEAEKQQSNSVRIRRSDLADILGVTLLSAHKAIGMLVKSGYITQSYGSLNIRDRSKMLEWISSHSNIRPI